jgi:lipoprotein-releasing system permease protein
MRLGALYYAWGLLKGRESGRERKASAGTIRGAVIGIGLSLVPLIAFMEIADGMIDGITARYIEVSGAHAVAELSFFSPLKSQLLSGELESVAKEIGPSPGLLGVYPEVSGGALALAGGSRPVGVVVKGIDSGRFSHDSGLTRYLRLESGAFELEGSRDILLSASLAKSLKAGVGDSVVMATTSSSSAGIRSRAFRVRGIFSTGYHDIDARLALMPYASASTFLDSSQALHRLAFKFSDPFEDRALFERRLDSVSKALNAAVAHQLGVSPTSASSLFELKPWYVVERTQLVNFQDTKTLLFIVIALIVLVASANLMSSLVSLVIDRQRDIAILKSAGMPPRTVRASFLCLGFLISLAGSLIGVSLGLFLAININEALKFIDSFANAFLGFLSWLGWIDAEPFKLLNADYYLQELPIKIDALQVLIAVFGTLALSLLACLVPAGKAARLKPLEVLRRQ